MKRKRPEWKLRRMQNVRTKPQRTTQPLTARETRVRNRTFTARS